MKLFITVGTTEFYQLVDLLTSEEGQKILEKHKVTLQYGRIKPKVMPEQYIMFDYTKEFGKYVTENDIIISTASAGTRLDVIGHKKAHLMVCNDTLAGNHQMEMVDANKNNKSCRVFEGPKQLLEYLKTADLEKEAQEMVDNIKAHASGEEELKQLFNEVLKRPHKNYLLFFFLTALILLVGVLLIK